MDVALLTDASVGLSVLFAEKLAAQQHNLVLIAQGTRLAPRALTRTIARVLM